MKRFNTLAWILIGAITGLSVYNFENHSFPSRQRQADQLVRSGRHEEAIRLYEKILRKDHVKPRLTPSQTRRLLITTADLYRKIGLENKSILLFQKIFSTNEQAGLSDLDQTEGLSHNLVRFQGLLEAGRVSEARQFLDALKGQYPGDAKLGSYQECLEDVTRNSSPALSPEWFWKLGHAYIDNGLYPEAENYFSRRLMDYGMQPLDILLHVKAAYFGEPGLLRKIWKDGVYVTLEDFESFNTALFWGSVGIDPTTKHRLAEHRNAAGVAYKGNRSEYFDVKYGKRGFDYWATKSYDIPINESTPNVGVRFYTKSLDDQTTPRLKLILYYPELQHGSIWHSDDIEHSEETASTEKAGWKKHFVTGLLNTARWAERESEITEVHIRHILLGTEGISNRFYVDEIELFIPDSDQPASPGSLRS